MQSRMIRYGTAAVLVFAGALASPQTRAEDWTQGYLGVGIGADMTTLDVRSDVCCTGLLQSGPVGGDLGLSIMAGADYQLNRTFVVGAFVSYDWSNIATSASITDIFGTDRADLLDIKQSWTVGGRFGVLATPSTLLYALLGYTWLDVEDNAFTPLPLVDSSGWTSGLGFEHKLGGGLSVRGEYRYTRLGQETVFDDPLIGPITADAEMHTARLIAAYRFGGSSPAEPADAAPLARITGGAYIGGGMGLEALTQNLSAEDPFFGGVATIDGIGTGSFGGTIVAGYDVMLAPRILAGAFASYDFSNSASSSDVSGFSFGTKFFALDNSWTIGARAGWTVTEDSLIYGLIGYTRVDPAPADELLSLIGIKIPSLDGVTIGGGFEKLIAPNLSLRAEYRYTMLEDARVDFIPGFFGLDVESALHSAKLTATYRFNAAP